MVSTYPKFRTVNGVTFIWVGSYPTKSRATQRARYLKLHYESGGFRSRYRIVKVTATGQYELYMHRTMLPWRGHKKRTDWMPLSERRSGGGLGGLLR